jgi:hypothetical protein
MSSIRSILYFFAGSFILFSCFKKEEFKNIEIQEINPAWGVPLLDSRLTLKDIVSALDTNLGVREENDNSYTFYYYDTIFSPKAEEIFLLPDQAFTKSVPSPFSSAVPFPSGKQVSSSFTETEIFDAGNGSSLKYILLKGGQMALTMSSVFKNNISIELILHSVLDQNQKPLIRNYDITPAKSFISDVVNLQGYKIALSENNGETNAFRYTVNYTVTSTGQPLDPGDGVFVSLNLEALKYSLIVGDIGDIGFPPFSGHLDLKVFDQASFGNVYFSQAKLNLTFNNSVGIPINFTINKLESSTSYNKSVDITPVNPPLTIALLAPALAQQGSFAITNVVLNSSNSRIVEAVNPAPDKLEYDFSTAIIHGTDNFILDQSQIKVYARIDIPLKGYVTNYELKDTLPIQKLPERSFSDNNIKGSIDSVVFKLKIENAIPANAYTQLYFLDTNYRMIDSLLLKPDLILASDHVDPVSGEVTSATTKETAIAFDAIRYDRLLERAKYFYIASRITTTTDASGKPINITLQSGNSLRVVISVLTKGKIKIQ